MVGSKRSIYHLDGFDELAALIDDPACNYNDVYVLLPLGGYSPGHFLLARDMDYNVIPESIIQRHLDFPMRLWSTMVSWYTRVGNALTAPDGVTESLAVHHLAELYPAMRPQSFPDTGHTVRIASSRDLSRIDKRVDEIFRTYFRPQPNIVFRGLSFSALERSMAVLTPGISPSSSDGIEFGPGIYIKPDFDIACDYACRNGAIMVFATLTMMSWIIGVQMGRSGSGSRRTGFGIADWPLRSPEIQERGYTYGAGCC